MKLSKAALHFDRDSVYDGYTEEFLWKAQFSSYDGSKPDGSFERRRTISAAPGTTNAERRVVKVGDERWVLGEFITDTFFDKPIRLTAGAKLVTDTYEVLTPGQAALKSKSNWAAYAQTRYLKDTVNSNTDSDYNPFYEVYFGSTEPIKDGYFLRSHNRLLHVRTSFPNLEGFHTAAGDEISYTPTENFGGNGEVDVEIEGGFDPVTELNFDSIYTTGILLDMYMLYNYYTQADALNRQGDKTLIVSNTVDVEAGNTIRVKGEPWQIKVKTPYFDAWNLHLRRA